MSTILIFFADLLACAFVAGWLFRCRAQRRYRLPFLNAFAGAATRKLAVDERSAIESYLDTLNRVQKTPVIFAVTHRATIIQDLFDYKQNIDNNGLFSSMGKLENISENVN